MMHIWEMRNTSESLVGTSQWERLLTKPNGIEDDCTKKKPNLGKRVFWTG